MNKNFDNPTDSHQQMALLLPWYANQSLSGQECKAMENHLATCLLCKRELRQLEKLGLAVKQDTRFDSAANASFSRLKQRIHADQGKVSTLARDTSDATRILPKYRQPRFMSRGNQRVWAIAAMLLLAVAIPLHQMKPDGATAASQFITLSDGRSETLKANEIRVVFTDALADADRAQVVAGIDGKISGKPSLQGVYTIDLAPDMDKSQILAKIDQLRKDKRVIFAEPAYALLSSEAPRGE